MEYILAIKRNEVLIYAITWVNFENIMPSKEATYKRAQLYDLFHMKYPEYANPETQGD